MGIGDLIRKKRLAKGYSLQGFSNFCKNEYGFKITAAGLYFIEKEMRVSKETIEKVVSALGLDKNDKNIQKLIMKAKLNRIKQIVKKEKETHDKYLEK